VKTILITERIVLREMEQRDFDDLYAMFNDPDVMRFYLGLKDRDETQAWLDWILDHYKRYGYGLFAAEHAESGEFLGQIGIIHQDWDNRIDLEVGYMLKRSAWDKGYATEAARACRDLAFARYRPDRVVSFITPENVRSQAVAKRNKMRLINRISHPRRDLQIDVWGVHSGDMR
jgi:RimJ/RimL family protein N-acetyltransferase